ncbi:MAG: Uma2 family endonuclease, partial [Deltaproteobacteria bacterium]|nr:Uma2 family endonuclease [Deltaproteobacteria bacterium]
MNPLPAASAPNPARVEYPDSDGEPMADNTEQWDDMVKIKENLDRLLPAAFVGGDLLWYPVEGDPKTRIAPDALVALGRPKGRRGSYMQWEENHQPPDVVIEIWSPRNRFPHQVQKLRFYDRFGVQEFWCWDLVERLFSAFVRRDGTLEPVDTSEGWTSPLLGVRFEVVGGELNVYAPGGQRFRTLTEIAADEAAALARAGEATARADEATARADEAT